MLITDIDDNVDANDNNSAHDLGKKNNGEAKQSNGEAKQNWEANIVKL